MTLDELSDAFPGGVRAGGVSGASKEFPTPWGKSESCFSPLLCLWRGRKGVALELRCFLFLALLDSTDESTVLASERATMGGTDTLFVFGRKRGEDGAGPEAAA